MFCIAYNHHYNFTIRLQYVSLNIKNKVFLLEVMISSQFLLNQIAVNTFISGCGREIRTPSRGYEPHVLPLDDHRNIRPFIIYIPQ